MGYGGLGDHEMAWLFHVIEAELLTTNISEVADQPLQSGAMQKHHD